MRIIAGQLKGLTFEAPKGSKTHPMGDRARGGLFNVLGDVSGLSVLDVFAGSGALSIEAVSRGAVQASAVEIDHQAYQVIKDNISKLKLGKVISVTQANAKSWLNNHQGTTYDLVLADPPYDHIDLPIIQELPQYLVSDGILVLSWPPRMEQPQLDGLQIVQTKTYGDAGLVFYRKIS